MVFDEQDAAESSEDKATPETAPAFVPDETSGVPDVVGDANEVCETSPNGSAMSEFEMLDNGEEDVLDTTGDPELDELEAEIARELED